MRKLLLSLAAAIGVALLGTAPASAGGAATTLARPDVSLGKTTAETVHWRRHHRRFGGLYFGFGAPYWGSYPRYRYYDDYSYYRPYYGHRHHYRGRSAYYRGGWHYRKFGW